MRSCVAGFRSGRRDISPLIADLEGLLRALQETSQSWCDRFSEAWWVLEIAYAIALDRQTALPLPTDPDVCEALDDIDALVAEVIQGWRC